MNERIKELAEQAGFAETLDYLWECDNNQLERFAELVRQDLYQQIGKGVITQINSAVIMEREACAKLCEKVADDYFYDKNQDGYDWPDGHACAEAI